MPKGTVRGHQCLDCGHNFMGKDSLAKRNSHVRRESKKSPKYKVDDIVTKKKFFKIFPKVRFKILRVKTIPKLVTRTREDGSTEVVKVNHVFKYRVQCLSGLHRKSWVEQRQIRPLSR